MTGSTTRPAIGIAAAVAASVLVCAFTASAGAVTTTESRPFGYNGDEQTFVVPGGVTSLNVVAVGASGAPGAFSSVAGKGARVSGTISVTPGEHLFIEVGAPGHLSEHGFNGGGQGGLFDGSGGATCDRNGGAGGGASDVRTVSRYAAGTLASRVVVAGGGGGGGGGSQNPVTHNVAAGGAGGDAGSNGGAGSGSGGGAGGQAGFWDTGEGGTGTYYVCQDGVGGGGGGGGGLLGGGRGHTATSTASSGGGGAGGTNLVPPAEGSASIDTSGAPAVVLSWTTGTPDSGTPNPVGQTIYGTAKNDVIQGTPGDDLIYGKGGNDVISGNGGNDTIIGGAGNDKLFGGDGNDAMKGGKGRDKCDGGNGTDTAAKNCERKLSIP